MRTAERPGRLRRIGGVLVAVVALAADLLLWGGATVLRGGGALPTAVVPAVAVGVYALLPLRGRAPVAVFLSQVLFGLAGAVLPGYEPFFGLLVALYTVARRASLPSAVLALVLCGAPFGVDCWNGAAAREHRQTSFATSFAVQFFFYALVSVGVWSLGRFALAAQRRGTRELAAQAAAGEAAVRAERLRLAGDLHDIVTHAVSAMMWQAAGARALVPDGDARVRAALTVIEDSGVQAMRELHRMLGLLRAVDADAAAGQESSPTLDDPDDLDGLVRIARGAGVRVANAEMGRRQELDRSVGLVGYRVVQEALTNVVKHGGSAPAATIDLDWAPEQLAVTVRSTNGARPARSSGDASSGSGLRGLGERVSLIGGTLNAHAEPSGWVVTARLPVVRPSVVPAPGAADPARTAR